MREDMVESYGKLDDLDRSFDIEFWQAEPPRARFDATWDLGIPGVAFIPAWRRRVEVDFDGLPVPFISREDLIEAKRASGRPQDLLDVASLLRER